MNWRSQLTSLSSTAFKKNTEAEVGTEQAPPSIISKEPTAILMEAHHFQLHFLKNTQNRAAALKLGGSQPPVRGKVPQSLKGQEKG